MLPLYFKHDNLRSFIRQLNIYGFQRCPNASGRDRTMEFFHPMFTRNGARNLKDIKRGNQSQKQQKTEPDVEPPAAAAAEENASEQPPAKKPRVDYSAFKMDVARLQKNLEARRRRAARAAAATARAHALMRRAPRAGVRARPEGPHGAGAAEACVHPRGSRRADRRPMIRAIHAHFAPTPERVTPLTSRLYGRVLCCSERSVWPACQQQAAGTKLLQRIQRPLNSYTSRWGGAYHHGIWAYPNSYWRPNSY